MFHGSVRIFVGHHLQSSTGNAYRIGISYLSSCLFYVPRSGEQKLLEESLEMAVLYFEMASYAMYCPDYVAISTSMTT
jgi:hypothetical protein